MAELNIGNSRMLDYVKFKIKLESLKWKLRKAYRLDDRQKEKVAKEHGRSSDAYHDLLNEQRFENSTLVDEIAQMETRQICRLADRLKVELPSYEKDNEFWYKSDVIGGWALTTKGYAKLRSEIRNERNEAWKFWDLRSKVIIAVLSSGVGGAAGYFINWVKLAGLIK